MPTFQRIVFVAIPAIDQWGGGGHELWSRAALKLVTTGFQVSVSLPEPSLQHARMQELRATEAELWTRPSAYPLSKRAWLRLTRRDYNPLVLELKRLISSRPPALVVLAEGFPFPPIELVEFCAAEGLPFVTIAETNWESVWYPDDLAKRYRLAISAARRCYFVSEANWRLAEKQIGGEVLNGEVVRNPFNVSYDTQLPWPSLGTGGELMLACVGRLHPAPKGQDILIEALAFPQWRDRAWRLTFYGDGPARQGLEWLVEKRGIADRVTFSGFCAVKEIWASNHVLVMPSRFEGLPLAMVEAMLCARPVVATDIAGHSELVEDGVTGFLADAPTPRSVAATLERFWDRRSEAERIGKAAARRIRELVPSNPINIFSEKLKDLATLTRAR